jgi:hypothetical protein
MTIEEARQDFKANFYVVKGILGVCTKSYWKPGLPADEPDALYVYVDNVNVIGLLPKEFMGFKCEYFVMPNGVHPGCD